MTVEKIYSSMSSAKRGALRAKMANPMFVKVGNKIHVSEAVAKVVAARVKVSLVETPVQKFRTLFTEQFGKVKRSELLKMAVDAGVAKNTAATYYQKLSKSVK